MTDVIATGYVEIRPTPDAKEDLKRGVDEAVAPAARGASERISRAISDGLKTPAGAGAAGVAVGTVLGRGVSAGLAATMRGLTLIPRTGFAELKDYQAGLAQLQAGIKSTGGAAGLTAGEMETLATAVQKYSGQTDDSIVRSESFLLTFDKIRDSVGQGNDVFTRATKATADLAARLGGDASGKAILLGKALNDPVAGLTALSRAGIQFDDSQKRTIKSLTESGQLLEAQKIVLAEVEKQVGGSAKAYGDTLPGQIDRGKRAFEDISQTILSTTFSFVEHNQKTTAAVAGVVGGIYAAHKAVLIYRAVQDTLFAGTAKKIAANAALARSYDGVAAAAGRAAGAETVAAGGGAAGAAGAGGSLGAAAAALRSGGKVARFAKGAGAAGLAYEVFDAARDGLTPGRTRDHQINLRQWQEDHGYRPKQSAPADDSPINTQGLVDPRLTAAAQALAAARGRLNDPAQRNAAMSSLAGSVGSPFDVLASRTQGDPVAAREAQRKADQAARDAQRDYDKVAAGSGGATRAQLTSAEARVAAAQAALRKRGGDDATEQRRLEAAEAHLSELRAKGGVNADRLTAAEERLKEARRTAASAADDTKKAEATTALSVQDLTKRLGGELKNSRSLRDDARKLIKNGVSEGVLTELYGLEKEAPGTLDRVAKSLTPAMAAALNKQYGDLQKVNQEFLTAPLRAAAEAAKAEQDKILAESAKRQAEVYANALRDNLLGGLGAPSANAPDMPSAGNQRGDGIDHRGTSAPVAVTVQLTGVKGETVHRIASTAIADADRTSGAMIPVL